MGILNQYDPFEDFMISKENLPGFNELGKNPAGFFDDADIEYFKSVPEFDAIKKGLDEGVLPDPYEIDSLFVTFFVSEGNIFDDFPWILQEFYRHEADCITSFSKIDYAQTVNRELPAFQKICKDGMSLIFNAFRDGNEYAKLTLQNLYKTYYRTEYRSFKRFDPIDIDAVFSLAGEGENLELDSMKAARIITVSQIFDKKIDPTVYYLYPHISEYGRGFREFIDKKSEWPVPAEEELKATVDELRDLFDFKKTREGSSMYEAVERYTSDFIKREGYYDFAGTGVGEPYVSMSGMKSLLAGEKCREDFSRRELLLISVMSQKIHRLCQELECRDDFIEEMLLGIQSNDVRYRPPKGAANKDVPKQIHADIRNDSAVEKDALLKKYAQEVERLQRELHLSKQETAHFRQQFGKVGDELALEKTISESMKEEHDELYTLRNYVYSLSEDDIAEDKRSTEELIGLLKGKKALVIGGHPNWTYKFRNMFPEWRFVSPTPSGSVDPGVMNKIDYALFFTDIISHSVYNKYIALAREKKVPFGYLHSTNVNASIREMARAMLAE